MSEIYGYNRMNSSQPISELPASVRITLGEIAQVRIMKSTKEVCCVARGGGTLRGLGFLDLVSLFVE